MATIKGYTGGLFTGKNSTALSPKESTISKAIQQYLEARKIYNDRLNAGQMQAITRYFEKKTQTWKEFRKWVYLCKKGTPDRFFIMSGRIYFVEVKTFGKTPTADQVQRHKELRRSGAVVIVADSIDSFIKQFESIVADRQSGLDTEKGDRKNGKKWVSGS